MLHLPPGLRRGLAMLCIVLGVMLGQTDWQKVLGNRFQPSE